MVEQGNRKAFSTFSSLRRFAQEESEKATKAAAEAAQDASVATTCVEPGGAWMIRSYTWSLSHCS